MFYNTYRATKAAQREAQKTKLSGAGQNIVNPRERLMNMQKRQKLKDLLVTRFMKKYGLNTPDKILDDEITKFLQGEKLNDVDLQKLDAKIHRLLMAKQKQENLKSSLTQNMQNQPPMDNQYQQPEDQQFQQYQDIPLESQMQPQNVSNIPMASQSLRSKKVYKTPEEELAELEAEEAAAHPKRLKLDFKCCGDEWNAIAQYNKKLYEMQQREEKLKDAAIKKKTKEELDNQVKQKLKREYEDELKEKEYDKIMRDHQKKLDDIERKKAEELRAQVLREKESRDKQMKDEYVRKRIDTLKEKKWERQLVKNIQDEIEAEKRAEMEHKRKLNEALKQTLKENELNKLKQLEQLKKEKADDIRSCEENAKIEERKELERKLYFKKIERNANNFMTGKAQEALDKMKRDEKEEDEKMNFYAMQKNKVEQEKEDKENARRKQQKIDMKKYLDMQVAEKQKEKDFEKLLDDEQARIWNRDVAKYFEDERNINNTIREMNKRNLDIVMDQMRKKKQDDANKCNMTECEKAINRVLLEQAQAMGD